MVINIPFSSLLSLQPFPYDPLINMANHDSNESANQEAWELGMSKSAIRKAKKKAANETYATVVQGVVQPSGGVIVSSAGLYI